jgi:alpha-galactosidase
MSFYTTSLLLTSLLLSFFNSAYSTHRSTPLAIAPANIKKIAFGKDGRLELDQNQGTFEIYHKNAKIVSKAAAEIKNGETLLRSTAYTGRKYERQNIDDAFGKGVKHVLTSSREGFPQMMQVFYTYKDRDFVLTEVLISGDALQSNYMAPIVSTGVNLHTEGDHRSLYVPFDNDTFVSYESKPMLSQLENTSSEVGAFYENQSRRGLIIGSVEHQVWKTGIQTIGQGRQLEKLVAWGGFTDQKITRDTIAHGMISGNLLKSPKILVGYFDDWREGMSEYGKANRLAEQPYVFNWQKPTPFGWNSWGAIQQKLSLEKAVKVVDFFTDSLKTFRNGNTAYIDLDSYWDNLLSGGLAGDYSKLEQFVAYCKSKGLEAGCYWAPFVDWGYQHSKPRRVEGSAYNYADIWTKVNGAYHDIDGARALDPTHPGTRERLALVIGKLKDCGFSMIKIDFLGHAAIEADKFYDPEIKTGMQAYKSGMEFLVDQLDSKMLIYAAISPNLASGRYVHMRRIACDAFKSVEDSQYTLNSLTYGWWQTHLYNYLDADHLVFGSESIETSKVRLASGLITGTLILGDDFSSSGPWQTTTRKLLQNEELLKLTKDGKAFTPIEGNSEKGSAEGFTKIIGGELYLAVFNWDKKEKRYRLPLSRLGLGDNKNYAVKELFNEKEDMAKGEILIDLKAGDVTIYSIK